MSFRRATAQPVQNTAGSSKIWDMAGQALLESVIVLTVVTSIAFGLGKIFLYQWRKSECAFLVFESVSAKLTGRRIAPPKFRVELFETSKAVSGTAVCGAAKVTVKLPKLEAARW